jgi:dTDP-4-dehydrorhamnose reductase
VGAVGGVGGVGIGGGAGLGGAAGVGIGGGAGLGGAAGAAGAVGGPAARAGRAGREGVELPADRIFCEVDARRPDDVTAVLDGFRPDAVVNAIGLVKQRPDGQRALPAVEVNAVFPHQLARLCRLGEIRLVHVSTDCVFSGRRGRYTEDDPPDPVDVYGMSKLLGEVRDVPAITLRTSIIGLEPAGAATGLIEWFLRQTGRVPGYRQAIYSGLTTMEFSRVVDRILTKHEDLSGLWHVAAEPVTKYDLLTALAERMGRRDVVVEPEDGVECDRSLVADRFYAATGYSSPGWVGMLDEMAERILRRNGGRHA